MNENKIIIREADKNDLKKVLELYKAINEENEIIDYELSEKILNLMKIYPYHKLFVVENEISIIGTFVLTIIDYIAHGAKKAGLLEDVIVSPEMRSKGIGKKILEYAIEECRKHNCYKIALSSNIKRERAHKFYEKNGFKIHGYSFWTDIENKRNG